MAVGALVVVAMLAGALALLARLSSFLVLIAISAPAQPPSTGDTITLKGTTWRLWGIDAPEGPAGVRRCLRAGHEPTAALRRLIHGLPVTCELRGHDRYGPSIGLCRAAGKDLGADMVGRRHGLGLHALQQRLCGGRARRYRYSSWRSRARLREALELATPRAINFARSRPAFALKTACITERG
jgi:hypothetical protein